MIKLNLNGRNEVEIDKLNVPSKCAKCEKTILKGNHHILLKLQKTRTKSRFNTLYWRMHFDCYDTHIQHLIIVNEELKKLKAELMAKWL